jgi:hypothetical protein
MQAARLAGCTTKVGYQLCCLHVMGKCRRLTVLRRALDSLTESEAEQATRTRSHDKASRVGLPVAVIRKRRLGNAMSLQESGDFTVLMSFMPPSSASSRAARLPVSMGESIHSRNSKRMPAAPASQGFPRR